MISRFTNPFHIFSMPILLPCFQIFHVIVFDAKYIAPNQGKVPLLHVFAVEHDAQVTVGVTPPLPGQVHITVLGSSQFGVFPEWTDISNCSIEYSSNST